jgi:uncharacterized protein YneF (UPF0154 family)
MEKKVPIFFVVITLFVLVCLGAYYFIFIKTPPTDTGWNPPLGNPPTKQMGVSVP